MGTERIVLPDGLDRVVREDVSAKRAYPAADVAERDGFCLRAVSTRCATRRRPALLEVVGSLNAGDGPVSRLGAGCAVVIMTGAILPEGADTVIPTEEASLRNGSLVVASPVERGRHVRGAGSVVRAGRIVARAGTSLRPGVMGLLAATGVHRVKVARRLRIGIISTGDEIVETGKRAKLWEAHGSNAVMLMGQAEEIGAETTDLGIAADRRADIIGRLRSGRRNEIVILTGGSSTGARDLVLDALQTYGCRVLVRGIRLRPGTHVIFARKGRQVIFGLPGRPAGCFALFHLLVRPAAMAMMGAEAPIPLRTRMVWGGDTLSRPATDTLVACRTESGCTVRPVSGKGCGDLTGIARSDSFVVLTAGAGAIKKGDRVEGYPIRRHSS